MTLPAFSISRPIARGIAYPIAAHEGVGAPAGYAFLLYKDGGGNYQTLLYKDANGAYQPLAYKVA